VRTLIWRPRALDQLDSLVGYIAERDKAAAERIEAMVQRSAETIAKLPLAGRPGRVAETREWVVHPNYILIYRVSRTQIIVLRFVHARQQYP
jgi:addiction module RelE/StbE family toxin